MNLEDQHDLVSEHLESCGEPSLAHYLHEEIDNPEKRSWVYESFIEWLEDEY